MEWKKGFEREGKERERLCVKGKKARVDMSGLTGGIRRGLTRGERGGARRRWGRTAAWHCGVNVPLVPTATQHSAAQRISSGKTLQVSHRNHLSVRRVFPEKQVCRSHTVKVRDDAGWGRGETKDSDLYINIYVCIYTVYNIFHDLFNMYLYI